MAVRREVIMGRCYECAEIDGYCSCTFGPTGTIAQLKYELGKEKAKIARVRELHIKGSYPDCIGCGDVYPRATIRALDEELEQ